MIYANCENPWATIFYAYSLSNYQELCRSNITFDWLTHLVDQLEVVLRSTLINNKSTASCQLILHSPLTPKKAYFELHDINFDLQTESILWGGNCESDHMTLFKRVEKKCGGGGGEGRICYQHILFFTQCFQLVSSLSSFNFLPHNPDFK